MIKANRTTSLRGRPFARTLVLLPVLAAALWACGAQEPEPTAASQEALAAAPSLGTAQSFAVLASSTLTNIGATTVVGDIGVSPGTAIIGFPPGTVTGTVHAGDAVAAQARLDATTAYNVLAGDACDLDLTGQNLGGLTLTAGVYCFSTAAQLTGTLTLDAQGNPNAVFVFQVGSTLTTAAASQVTFINGGQPCNVFWQVGTSATIGAGTAFAGDILALTSVTLSTGANVVGRALARNGAVTMDTNQIVAASCALPGTTAAATTGSGAGATTGSGVSSSSGSGAGGATTSSASSSTGTGSEPVGCTPADWTTANQGWILGTPTGQQGDFILGAGYVNGVLKGFFHYVDLGSNETIVATDVTSYVVTGPNSRQIMGHATVNGVAGFTYTINTTDGGASDFFSLVVSDGYHASGTLAHIVLSVTSCP
ncbi:MAG: ice-binding family protein [Byssovorax sp.]